mmetsp:Transcript_4346/g.8199  ORF Transcript_4346/g.8199 Transcript_4346/m.8199 type:complete len:281 (-) Transcript_4346:898-1740(-)
MQHTKSEPEALFQSWDIRMVRIRATRLTGTGAAAASGARGVGTLAPDGHCLIGVSETRRLACSTAAVKVPGWATPGRVGGGGRPMRCSCRWRRETRSTRVRLLRPRTALMARARAADEQLRCKPCTRTLRMRKTLWSFHRWRRNTRACATPSRVLSGARTTAARISRRSVPCQASTSRRTTPPRRMCSPLTRILTPVMQVISIPTQRRGQRARSTPPTPKATKQHKRGLKDIPQASNANAAWALSAASLSSTWARAGREATASTTARLVRCQSLSVQRGQ